MKLAWIRGPDGEDGIIALFPVGAVSFVVGVDFQAIIEAVAMATQRINQEIRPLIPSNLVARGKHAQKKSFNLNWAIGEVEGNFRLHSWVDQRKESS